MTAAKKYTYVARYTFYSSKDEKGYAAGEQLELTDARAKKINESLKEYFGGEPALVRDGE